MSIMPAKCSWKGDTVFVGALLLLLGILMLLERMDIIYGPVWDYFWPICIVALGIHLILKNRAKPS